METEAGDVPMEVVQVAGDAPSFFYSGVSYADAVI
nr:hypothetical protein [Tanacetum cinerariifolium]